MHLERLSERGRVREKEIFHMLIQPPLVSTARSGLNSETRNANLGLALGWQGPEDLGHLPVPFQEH